MTSFTRPFLLIFLACPLLLDNGYVQIVSDKAILSAFGLLFARVLALFAVLIAVVFMSNNL